MSYCRWSSMDFKSDLYVYANVSGAWTIHVAGNRLLHHPPRQYEWPEQHKNYIDGNRFAFTTTREGADAEAAWQRENNPRVDITLPHAGETFDTASPGDCADKIEELVALGYICPDYVVPELRAEQAEMDAETPNA